MLSERSKEIIIYRTQRLCEDHPLIADDFREDGPASFVSDIIESCRNAPMGDSEDAEDRALAKDMEQNREEAERLLAGLLGMM